MKKLFDEKFGLAVNVFSWVALMLLLLGAYIFRSGQHADKNEEKQETMQKRPTEVFHSSIVLPVKKVASWDDPLVKKPGILLGQFDKY
jgi:hypothetical protein